MRILFVCTANVCRSPLAERVSRSWLHEVGQDGRHEVASRGLSATAGRAMDPRSAAVLAELGGDATGASARPLLPGEAEAHDLVLTMTRRHRRDVLGVSPRAMRRTFTLLEAAELAAQVDPDELAGLSEDDLGPAFAAALNAGRASRSSSEADDVADPYGHGTSAHRTMGRTVLTAVGSVLQQLPAWSPQAPATARPGRPHLVA